MISPVIQSLKSRYARLDAFDFEFFSSLSEMEAFSLYFVNFLNQKRHEEDDYAIRYSEDNESELEPCYKNSGEYSDDAKALWSQLLSDHLILDLEYSILRQQLHANLLLLIDTESEALRCAISEQLLAAFMYAKLLEHLYFHLNESTAVLCNQQKFYKALLTEDSNFDFKTMHKDSPEFSKLDMIRQATVDGTWWRLFLSRSKRLIELIGVLGTGWQFYQDFAASLTRYANPVLGYVGWGFFIPRLVANLTAIGLHTLPIFTNEYEKKLDWWVTGEAQILRRGFELANDGPWLLVGVINFGYLVGSCSPYAATLTLIFYGYDVLIASLRALVELNRLCKLKKAYQEIKTEESDDYQVHLDTKIEFETWKLGLNIMAAFGVFIGGIGALALFAACPTIPFLGALTLFSVSLFLFVIKKMLTRFAPINKPEEIPLHLVSHPLGFFSKSSEGLRRTVPTNEDSYEICSNHSSNSDFDLLADEYILQNSSHSVI
ncbi:MAG: hypothetical protein H0U75_04150 [Legionella sp.]|nr:hypothetical protein [Legionella sp.]